MANPRKFSEKIALHNQKQAEETAAFEQIMREVSDATSKPDETTLAQYGLASMQHSHLVDNMKNNENHANSSYRESRGRSVGVGPMRRPADRKIDTSPYSSGNAAYLSPPSDSSWRRTSSDSAIHQSLTQNQDHSLFGTHSPFSHSPVSQRRMTNVTSNIDIKSLYNEHDNQNMGGIGGGPSDGRPRSSCGLSRVPGINISPSAHDNSIQIPIGNNTGSLPDLTSVHFPSPLHTPLDQELDHSSSPYSSSPITASPTTLSPTSIPTRHPNASFQYSPANSPGDSNNTFSPTHSQHGTSQRYLSVPGSKYLHIHKVENAYHQHHQHQQHQQHHQQQQQHQQEQQRSHSVSHQQSYRNLTNQQQLNYQQQSNQQSHSPPNNVLHGSHDNLTNLGGGNMPQSNLSGYRSPKCRPSPGSSPSIASGSIPGDSNTSAPCSPASQTMGNNGQYEQFQTTEFYLSPSMQQHFEQFSLVDNSVSDYITQPTGTFTQFDDGNFAQLNSTNLDASQTTANMTTPISPPSPHAGIQQQQQHQQHQQQQQSQQQQQQPQQTIPPSLVSPTLLSPQQQSSLQGNNTHQSSTQGGIPEIIFTDFSSAASDLPKDFFSDGLRPIDLELVPMGLAEYQMLSDPNATMIADPTIEDSFRRDLN